MQYLRKSKRHKTRKQTVSFSLLRPGGQLLNNGRLVLKKKLFFCVDEYAEYGFDQQRLICLSPVGYGA